MKEVTGYSPAIIKVVARNLGLEAQLVEEVPHANMIEALNSGRVDIIASVAWRNSTRGRAAIFSNPVFYSQVMAYVRSSDRRFATDLSRANDPSIRISAIDGELAETIARHDYPKAQLVSLPRLSPLSQMLTQVQYQKADIAFFEVNNAVPFLRNNPGVLRQVPLPKPLRIYADCFMMKMGEFELKAAIDAGLEEAMTTGVVDSALARYEFIPGAKLRVALPYQPKLPQ